MAIPMDITKKLELIANLNRGEIWPDELGPEEACESVISGICAEALAEINNLRENPWLEVPYAADLMGTVDENHPLVITFPVYYSLDCATANPPISTKTVSEQSSAKTAPHQSQISDYGAGYASLPQQWPELFKQPHEPSLSARDILRGAIALGYCRPDNMPATSAIRYTFSADQMVAIRGWLDNNPLPANSACNTTIPSPQLKNNNQDDRINWGSNFAMNTENWA